MEQAKALVGRMHDLLEKKHGIGAEQAFGIFDSKDKGLATTDEFKRVLHIFFGDILVENSEQIEMLMRMTTKTVD